MTFRAISLWITKLIFGISCVNVCEEDELKTILKRLHHAHENKEYEEKESFEVRMALDGRRSIVRVR